MPPTTTVVQTKNHAGTVAPSMLGYCEQRVLAGKHRSRLHTNEYDTALHQYNYYDYYYNYYYDTTMTTTKTTTMTTNTTTTTTMTTATTT